MYIHDHGYLVEDFHSRTNKELRLRTDIFYRWYTEGDARGPIVYSSALKEKTHFDIIHFHVTRRWVNTDIPYTSNSVLAALQNLSQQTSRVEREAVLKAGLKEILKWFTLAAKNIIENKVKLPKQTTTFMTKHREEIQRLADPSIDEEMKRKIILKPGRVDFSVALSLEAY